MPSSTTVFAVNVTYFVINSIPWNKYAFKGAINELTSISMTNKAAKNMFSRIFINNEDLKNFFRPDAPMLLNMHIFKYMYKNSNLNISSVNAILVLT